MKSSVPPIHSLGRSLRKLHRVGLSCITAAALAAIGTAAQAAVVTLGPNPVPLPNCPDPGLPGKCAVDTAAQVLGPVGNLSAVRIGQSGQGSLLIGDSASLSVSRLDLAPGVPWVPDVVVGDNVGSIASLAVRGSGRLDITVPAAFPFNGGLVIGAFAAPQGHLGASTTMSIMDGGHVRVEKPGGTGVGSAVFVGQAAGSNSSLLLDGGIGAFGAPALGATLDTTGNLSIGRLGTGTVALFRNAKASANLVAMSTVGASGSSFLGVGVNSTLTAAGILAGIGLSPNAPGYDPNSKDHGTALVSVRDTGFINAPIVLGRGGTLMGNGVIGSLVSNFGGTIRPGFSPGTLTILGDYVDVGGHIEIEIGSNGSDFLDVLGKLSLDGTTIEFKFIDGFAPDAGFSYDFIDADGLVDLTDVHYSFSGLQAGFQFDVRSDPGSGILSFTALTAGTSVPEPGMPALLGLAGLAAWATRRRGTSIRLASMGMRPAH
jgi:hypothetical protein